MSPNRRLVTRSGQKGQGTKGIYIVRNLISFSEGRLLSLDGNPETMVINFGNYAPGPEVGRGSPIG